MPSTLGKSAIKKPKPESPVFSPEALDQLLEGHRTVPNWGRALNAFAILFEERMPNNLLNSFTQNF